MVEHGSDALSGAKDASITSDPEAARRSAHLIVLALDTTTRSGSAAVLRDHDVLSEVSGDPALTHGQRLPGDLGRALDAAGLSVADLDLLAVVAGPGSFTGLRIGIAAVQGLALSRGLSVVPVSALDALARLARRTDDHARVAAWIDAQRGEVFAALFEARTGDPLVPPASAPPGATLEAWAGSLNTPPILFAGDGAVRYQETILGRLGAQARIMDPAPALAAEAGRMAIEHPERAVPPHGIVPIYVRRPDAELARSRAGR